MTEITMKQIGKIDETGYLKSFKRQGFTHAKCILELVANSLDSLDSIQKKCIHFHASNKIIKMIDNGIGMDENGVENMFALHRENHSYDTSRGVSGYGAKVSLSILSAEKETTIYTHRKEGRYLKVTVPWQKIHEKGQYTGMIYVSEMNEKERQDFCDERLEMMSNDEQPIGTTIVFPYNDPLYNIIRNNFLTYEDQEDIYMKPLDRISIVFGREENVHITCTLPEGSRILELYNYFGANDIDYWGGIMRETIELWTYKDECRFLWRKADDTSFEVKKSGTGYAKKAEICKKNMQHYTHVGDYEVSVGLRKQANIDPRNVSGGKIIGEYDAKFLGDNEEYLGSQKLVRNTQGIGLIPPEVKISNLRANADQNFEIMLVQCDVSFSPTSSQDNKQDQITGIQQNKNQFDGGSLPKNFTRLIHHIKMHKSKELLKLFQEENNKKPEEENNGETIDKFIETNSFEIKSEKEKVEEERVEQEKAEEERVEEERVEEERVEEERVEEEKVEEESVEEERLEEKKPEEKKLEEKKLFIPIDVKGHRKGCVLGDELYELFANILSSISQQKMYTDSETIELFNKLRNFKFGV